MNKHLVRAVPVAIAALFLTGQQLYASGNFTADRVIDNPSKNFETIVSKSTQTMYLMQDSDVYQDTSNVSASIARETKGTAITLVGVDGELCEVLTSTGQTGYIPVSRLTTSPTNIFNEEDRIMYTTADAEVKQSPNGQSTTIATYANEDEVHLVGSNGYQYWQVEKDGAIGYVDAGVLTDVKPVHETPATFSAVIPSSTWDGTPLNPSAGVIIGPSGKESYYNLNMSGCVGYMKAAGIDYEYWVREDGVKMYGDYVMIAADFAIRPRGSLVETSLGTGIVVDTGTFIYSNPTQIDIAVAW